MYKGSAYHVPASYILYAITTRARANHLHHRNRTPSSRHWQRNSILSKSMNRDRIRGLKNKSFCTDYLSISRPISIIEGNLSSNRPREIKLNCEIVSKFQVEGKKKQIQGKRFQFIIASIGKVVSKSFQNPSNHGLRGLSLTIPPIVRAVRWVCTRSIFGRRKKWRECRHSMLPHSLVPDFIRSWRILTIVKE